MEVSNGLIPAIFFRPAFSYVLKLREDNIFWLSPQLLQVSHQSKMTPSLTRTDTKKARVLSFCLELSL